nr:unnamed protein product [Digitaria exilis]
MPTGHELGSKPGWVRRSSRHSLVPRRSSAVPVKPEEYVSPADIKFDGDAPGGFSRRQCWGNVCGNTPRCVANGACSSSRRPSAASRGRDRRLVAVGFLISAAAGLIGTARDPRLRWCGLGRWAQLRKSEGVGWAISASGGKLGITPYVLLRRPDGGVFTDDVSEASPVDGYFMRYKWYKIITLKNSLHQSLTNMDIKHFIKEGQQRCSQEALKQLMVEFNKAAQSLTDAIIPAAQKKLALNRLVKDNIALIAVLEAKFGNHGTENPSKRQLLCVANTHINIQHDLKDVKLWQIHTLLKGLEKIAVSADIPMLVCGDFNSTPGSTSHGLLAMGKVDQLHPDLAVDPLGILRPLSKLTHQLPLVSAYSSFARMAGVGYDLDHQRRRMDPTTNEPLFTNCTRDFTGTIDYIFYTADSLTVESLLELLDEDSLRKDTALPSPEWSSDHLALLAEFRCTPRVRR